MKVLPIQPASAPFFSQAAVTAGGNGWGDGGGGSGDCVLLGGVPLGCGCCSASGVPFSLLAADGTGFFAVSIGSGALSSFAATASGFDFERMGQQATVA